MKHAKRVCGYNREALGVIAVGTSRNRFTQSIILSCECLLIPNECRNIKRYNFTFNAEYPVVARRFISVKFLSPIKKFEDKNVFQKMYVPSYLILIHFNITYIHAVRGFIPPPPPVYLTVFK